MNNVESLKKLKDLKKRRDKIDHESNAIRNALKENCDISSCQFRRYFITPSETDEYGRYTGGGGNRYMECALCHKTKECSFKESIAIEKELEIDKLSREDREKVLKRTIWQWGDILFDETKKEKFIRI